jgi:hypothetical protein
MRRCVSLCFTVQSIHRLLASGVVSCIDMHQTRSPTSPSIRVSNFPFFVRRFARTFLFSRLLKFSASPSFKQPSGNYSVPSIPIELTFVISYFRARGSIELFPCLRIVQLRNQSGMHGPPEAAHHNIKAISALPPNDKTDHLDLWPIGPHYIPPLRPRMQNCRGILLFTAPFAHSYFFGTSSV